MTKIGMINGKGGAGKSTACIALAAALATRHRVALVDLDPQGSVSRWWGMAQQPANLTVFKSRKPSDLDKLPNEFDFVVVDTKGELSAEALPYLDLALLPCAPSLFDVWALADTIDIVTTHQAKRPALRAAIFVNRLKPNTVLGKDVQDSIFDYGVPCLRTVLRSREGYPLSIARGKTPVSSGDSDIRLESLRLAEYVKKFIATGETGQEKKK